PRRRTGPAVRHRDRRADRGRSARRSARRLAGNGAHARARATGRLRRRRPRVPRKRGRDPRGSSARDARVTGSEIRFVALGDSYTIGTATASSAERWPDQLVARIGPDGGRLRLVANLAVNGFTSRDVIEEELPAVEALRPELVSLLIGVN